MALRLLLLDHSCILTGNLAYEGKNGNEIAPMSGIQIQ